MEPTYSEAMYLFADKFITKRAKLFNLENHPTGEKIPVKPLSESMVLSALCYLQENGYITLKIQAVKRLLVIPGKDVFITKHKDAPDEVTGIEDALLGNCTKKDQTLYDAVYHLLRRDESLPWGDIINLSKESLAEKGLLQVEKKKKLLITTKKYTLDEKKRNAYIAVYEKTKTSMESYKKDSELFEKTQKVIGKAIAARKEKEDTDFD